MTNTTINITVEGFFPLALQDQAHNELTQFLDNPHNWNETGSETGSFAYAVSPKYRKEALAVMKSHKGFITSVRIYRNGEDVTEEGEQAYRIITNLSNFIERGEGGEEHSAFTPEALASAKKLVSELKEEWGM